MNRRSSTRTETMPHAATAASMTRPALSLAYLPSAALCAAFSIFVAGCARNEPAPQVAAVPPPGASTPSEMPPRKHEPYFDALSNPAEGAASASAAEAEAPESDLTRSLGSIAGAPPPENRDNAALAQRAYSDAVPRAKIRAEFAPPPAAAPLADIAILGGSPQHADNTERYQHPGDNPLKLVANDPVSTFSLDVDTGSYSNVRRFLAAGHRPPEDAVRVEELINYFPYDYPSAGGEHPFGVRTDLAPCPWNSSHWLLRVAVRASEVGASEIPPSNLVFLVDVSGSMEDTNKLPLLRSSLKLLVAQLRAEDRVSFVVYAGREAVVLEPTPGDQHVRIERAIDDLVAGGSTAGEAGIRLAYRMARQAFIEHGINRVLLATDGDFNVGVTDFQQLKDLVEHERESGVQLSTLGFGTGDYNEQLMEQLADAGNGSYAYIDTLAEGRKVLVDQMHSTLVTVAKDVKVQVEFNSSAVQEYRLIGYENRVLAREDFNNDRIDAGDVGAGQSVTALYELTPVGAVPSVDPLRYGAASNGPAPAAGTASSGGDEIAFVKLRYKQPHATTSRLVEVPIAKSTLAASFEKAADDFRFAAAVAGFGQLLRGGKRTGAWSWDDVLQTASASRGADEFGYRSEFLSLVRMARISS